MNFRSLNSINQIAEIDAESAHKKVLIFKHSTRCSISGTVLNRLRNEWKQENDENISLYLLDLLNHRDISNQLATHYGITHESPQVLVIENGKCVYHESHYGISHEELLPQIK